MPRKYKRAYSECPQGDPLSPPVGETHGRSSSMASVMRTQSDSDLSKIDRKRTFAQINTVEPNDLLAKVANALGHLRPPDDDDQMHGVHGFSDSQILASERTWGGWSNTSGKDAHNGRSRIRASSETKLPDNEGNNEAYEWTWSGADNQINDLRTLRQKSGLKDLYRASFGAAHKRRRSEAPNQSTVIAIPGSGDTTITSGQNTLMGRFNNIFNRKRTMSTSSGMMQQLPSNIHEDAIKYLKATSNEYNNKNTTTSLQPPRGPGGYSRRGSIFESLQSENAQILENTTIADLIKVLEAVHTQAALGDQPKRKMGTASLTPPGMPSVFGLFDTTPNPKTYETYNPALARRGSMFPALSSFQNASRRSSLMPTSIKSQPPPYSSLDAPGTSAAPSLSAANAKRRFSVRPARLNSYSPHHSSNTSLASSSSASQVPPVTRKLSLRPSPLAREPTSKPISLQREVINQNARQRHGSISILSEKPPEKKRYDSK